MTRITVNVQEDVRAARRAAAERFREERAAEGTLVVRLLSSPGAGKTTLLQRTAAALRPERVGILVGDVETQRDAERLAPFAPSHQITTGGACHLELPLIERDLPKLGPQPRDYLFLEDIGNLICPASHDLGEHLRVVLLSTPEGDDKPGKYPKAFRHSDVVVITKADLLPYVPFDVQRATEDARRVRGDLRFFVLAGLHAAETTQPGLSDWLQFLRQQRQLLGTAHETKRRGGE